MEKVRILLNAYQERLHERLERARAECLTKIELFLQQELTNRGFGESLEGERYGAYLEAAQSFVTERIEMYNPTGMQYLYDGISAKEAIDVDMQLNWYDSGEEFEVLKETARALLAEYVECRSTMYEMAEELIRRCGAYPNQSIIEGYESEPALRKLPDYVAAKAIEEMTQST